MKDYILLMYGDAVDPAAAGRVATWGDYLSALRESGQFQGGSAIGAGERHHKSQVTQPASQAITGFIRVRAEDLEDARRFLVGNPVHEAGGTVEIRELPRE